MRLPRLMIGLALISSFANLAAADDFQDRAFDAVSGRDIRNFPPDPQVKFNHLKLDLRMEKPESKSFSCTETITFTTLGKPLGWLDLNATDLKITSVKNSTGAPLDFRYDGEKLTIRFPKELAPATDAGVQIEYECQDPKGGMIFALPDAAYKDRPVIIHTQGEAEQSRNWFICHDSPNARFTTETLVTVPAKYLVVGNGKLVEKKDLSGGLVQYHHLMEQPHSAYLTSLVIGDLAVVTDQWRGRPVEYYAPKSMEPDLRRTFGKTPKMIELFSQLTGVDYPYAKYSQSVVWLFGAGGMENISATTLLETSVLDERRMLDSDSESLISHELAHQWFGDMVTCKSWQHLWLNEGFATFMAWVWAEHEQGPDEYTCQIYNTFRGIAESDSVDLSSGVVWPFYADPEETFGRPGSNPYPKGGSAIHMLRRSLGDELFWKCIGEYLRRYQWKTAETDDLRKVVDELSGQSYEQFFHQWLYRPGVPLIKVGYDWNEGAKEVRLTFEQTQKITKDAPVFEADVDVWLVMPDGTVTKHVAHMDTKTTGLTLKCDKEPAQVCIDPSISLLTQFDLKLPEPMLVRELKEGPTIGTRLHALHELQEKDSDAARDAMKIVLLDEKAPQGLRREVAAALGRNQQDGARQILLDSLAQGKAIADPRIRAAALRALGSYKNVDAAATLLRYARSDPAFGVEAAATSGLGRQKPTEEIIVTLLANTKKTGGADQIRIAAVSALAALEEPRGLDAAFELAAYGQAFRSRPPGIRALAQLGKKDDATSKKVRDFLENLLADPQSQSLEAAISALGTLSDPAAIPVLEKFTAGSAADAEKQSARRAIDAINRKTGDPAIISDLRSRIEKLEKEREDMEKKLQKLNKNQ